MDEKDQIEAILLIPISNVIDQGPYVDVYSEIRKIGAIPIVHQGHVHIFDTSEQILMRLDWGGIYHDYANIIMEKIRDLFPGIDLQITVATFRKLYIRFDNEIRHVECVYRNNEWKVFDITA